MTDREKVIKGLECCASIGVGIKTCGYIPTQNDCPYAYLIEENWNGCDSHVECTNALAADALKLLKEQEPRVMTLEETKAFGWDYCYLEELRLPGKEYRAVCGDYALTCITWPCTTSMRIQHGDGNYNKTWRCWTEKPTEEQRKAVKWDAAD